LIAITDQYSLLDQEIEDLRRTAETEGRILVVVAATASRNLISWEDFTEGLGGAVPTWHALTDEYEPALLAAAQNQIPKGMDGEAWLLFEDLVAHGLEFVFGRRVRRLGGRTRGRPVSDMQAQLPQGDIVVVDTKASASGFDVGLPNLRPLVEYVNRQRERQRGHLNLIGALVVSSKFRQGSNRLQEISREFLGEARLPVSFLTSDLLANSVKLFRTRPDARNGIRWNHILTGGLLEDRSIQAELSAVDSERIGIGG
jgi:hypothetical protein